MIAVVMTAVILTIVFGVWTSAHWLRIEHYEIDSGSEGDDIHIALLTDLHNSEFGDANERLLSLVAEQAPDLIVFTGDVLDRREEDLTIAVNLLTKLSQIAPLYVSLGNHEEAYQASYGIDLKEIYESCGATVLEYDYVDLTVNGRELRLGGLYGYCQIASYLPAEASEEECAYIYDFQNTDRYTVLLCHMPLCWQKQGLDFWDVDLVLSGHVHGGQIILPGIGGVYAPDHGWFPGRLTGVFGSKDGRKHMVVSPGLGSIEYIPRFNNIPEITMVTIR